MIEEQIEDPKPKQTVSEFAAKIKTKYPVYKDMDDNELVKKIVDKYPVYKDQVSFEKPRSSNYNFIDPVERLKTPAPQPTKEELKQAAIDEATAVTKLKNGGFLFNDEKLNSLSRTNNPMRSDAVMAGMQKPVDVTKEGDSDAVKVQKNIEKFKRTDAAINLATQKVLSQKGITATEGSAPFNKEKEKIRQAVDNGDAVLAYQDADINKPILKRSVGFIESFKRAWNKHNEDSDESDKFMNEMTAPERVAYLKEKEKQQEQNDKQNFPYEGSKPTYYGGGAGQFAGENAPFLVQAGKGMALGTAAILAAPESAGASLTGLPAALAFMFTAPEMINSGAKEEVTRRFYALKKENPDWTDEQAMEEADKGKWAGGLAGGVTNLLLMSEGGQILKQPINEQAKKTLGNFIKGTGRSAFNMGATTSAVSVATDLEGAMEGIKVTPEEVANKATETFVNNATVGGLLHMIMAGVHNIPPLVKNGVKFALVKSTDLAELKKTIKVNEEQGIVPEGTSEKVVNDLGEFKEALSKTQEGLSDEAQAAVAGLIQKKQNLVAEQSLKDDSAKPIYKEQIDKINEKIDYINRTGKVEDVEFDNITGEKAIENTPSVVEETTAKQTEPVSSSALKTEEEKGGENSLKENEYYHATDNSEIISPSEEGYKKREGNNVVGEGIYFGKDKDHLTDRYGKNVIKAELDIKNPLISDNKYIVVDGREIDIQSLSKEDIAFLKEKGYDSVKYEAADKNYSKFNETIVFDKSQIKILQQPTDATPETNKPVQPAIEGTKEQGVEENVQQGTTGMGEGNGQPATPVLKFPLPEKPVTEMNSKELEAYSDNVREYTKQTKLTSEQEANLTPEQSAEYFGKNLPKDGVYDPTEINRIANRVSLIEEADNVGDIADTIKRPLIDYARKQDTENLAVLTAAKRRAEELGIDPTELITTALSKVKGEFKDRTDAEMVVNKVFDGMMKDAETLTEKEQSATELLPESFPAEEIKPENIDEAKDYITQTYGEEAFSTIKEYLNEEGRLTEEPGRPEQQNSGSVENKETAVQGKAEKSVEEDRTGGLTPTPEEQEMVIQKAGFPGAELLKRIFTSNRGLPEFWMVLKDLAIGERQLAARNMRKQIYDLQDAVKATKYTDTDAISAALKDLNGPEFASLPPEVQSAVHGMRMMVDGYSQSLVTNGYVTKGQAITISNNVGEYLNRAYKLHTDKNWALKVKKDQAVIDSAIQYLAQQNIVEIQADPKFANLTPQEVVDRAFKLAKQQTEDILSLKETPTGQRYTEQFSKDISVLKKREDIPEPIRKLMGEYTDPVTQFALTVSKIATLHSQAKLLNDLKKTFAGELFFEKNDIRPEGFNYEVAADGSQTWNPLAGLYTSENVIKALQEQSNTIPAWQALYQKVFGTVKKLKTVYSIPTQVVNFVANPFISLANGHFDISKINKSWEYYKDTMFNKERGSDEIIETLVKRNVIGTSVNLRQIKDMMQKDKAEEFALSEFINQKRSNWNPMKWVTGIDKVMQKQYGSSDSFWKVYGFMNEAASFSDALYGKKYKDLSVTEKDKVDEIASERIKNTYPTYDRALPALMAMGKNVPFIGNFMAFQAEVMRTIKNNVLYAKQDLADPNPKIKQMGAKRIAGLVSYVALKQGINVAAVLASGNAVSTMWASAFGSKEDEDKRKSLDKFAPAFLETHNLMVETKGNGVYSVFDIDRLDPYNSAWQTINAFKAGKNAGANKALLEAAGPFIEKDMLLKAYLDINKNEDFSGKPIYNEADDEFHQNMSKMAYVYRVIEPTTAKYFNRVKDSDSPTKEAIASLFGARSYDIDVKLNFKSKVKDAESKLSANGYFNYKDKEGKEKEKIKENFKRTILELKDYYESALKLGASKKEVDEMVKKSFMMIGGAGKIKKMLITGKINDADIEKIYEKKKK